jgi:hypothetical protein
VTAGLCSLRPCKPPQSMSRRVWCGPRPPTSRHVRVFMLPTVVHSYTGGSADPEADTFGYRAACGPLKSKGGEFW